MPAQFIENYGDCARICEAGITNRLLKTTIPHKLAEACNNKQLVEYGEW
jgi:hypothetical protein